MNKNSENIFPAHLAFEALKYGPYSNSASAIAEIIDNSVDAGAKNIHVAVFANKNAPISVAVLDDGDGMDGNTLRYSVQYGHGTKNESGSKRRRNLGRYGVGLISASISQCHDLNIWSWTNGMTPQKNGTWAANKISINVNSIRESGVATLPHVSEGNLPEGFTEAFRDFPKITNPRSGTLVEWRDFHNLTWKRASKLCEHVKKRCGRVYRNFIRDKKLKIILLVYDINSQEIDRMDVPSIDPMFLHVWDDKALAKFSSDEPMFEAFLPSDPKSNACHEDGSPIITTEIVYDEDSKKPIGEYRLQFSCRRKNVVVDRAKDEGFDDPGDSPFGRLANDLRGISILREGRELTLDTAWLQVDTVDRWIKVSIDFDSSLDKIFGVHNNKQGATSLSNLARVSKHDLQGINTEGVYNKDVVKAALKIKEGLAAMRKVINEERRGSRPGSQRKAPEATTIGQLGALSKLAEERAKEDSQIPSDTEKQSMQGLIDAYDGTSHETKPAVDSRPKIVMKNNLRVDFVVVSNPDMGEFIFDVREKGGILLVVLNQYHPLYEQLSEMLSPGDNNGNGETEAEAIRKKLNSAIWIFQQLFYSFARAEREAQGRQRGEFQNVRLQWGRLASFILENKDD